MWNFPELMDATCEIEGHQRRVVVRYQVAVEKAASDTQLAVTGALQVFEFSTGEAEITARLPPAELDRLRRVAEEHLPEVRAGIAAEIDELRSGVLLGAILRGGHRHPKAA